VFLLSGLWKLRGLQAFLAMFCGLIFGPPTKGRDMNPDPTEDDAPPALWLLIVFLALFPYAVAFGIAVLGNPQ
jgi:hypothetical protein